MTWTDNSKNETGFVIERRIVGSTNGWSTLATVTWPLDRADPGFVNGPGTGPRTYTDRVGNSTLFEYQVYAINTVGDIWNYANPAFNEILKGGWPTLTLDSRGGVSGTVAAPSNLGQRGVEEQQNSHGDPDLDGQL